MSYILEKLELRSSLIIAVVFLGLFLFMLNIINGNLFGVAKLKQLTNGIGIIDMEPGYSIEKAYEILESQGEKGRNYYLKRIIPMDFIFPITYMLFYISTLLFLLKLLRPQNWLVHNIVFFPAVAMIFDYLENFSIIRMLVNYPKELIMTAKIANIFTILKLSFIFLSILSILVLLVLNIILGFIRTRVN